MAMPKATTIEGMPHASIPGLPRRLWQAAFYMDLLNRHESRPSEEIRESALNLAAKCDEVAKFRERKLGW